MEKKKIYGLIGKKLGHSFSPGFFNKKFKDENINAEYKIFPIPEISLFPTIINENPTLSGLNVTVPYKELVIPYLDSLSEDVQEIKALNVIQFKKTDDGLKLIGYNSDVYGFKLSLLPFLKPDIKNALVLGTGGASKAVTYVLKKLGINITLVSRTPHDKVLGYDNLTKEVMEFNLLIVNTTPLGMYPDIERYPPIPYEFITPDHVCYDLIYNPDETEFLKKAKEKGAAIKNGLEMLRLQAKKSWEIWNE